MLQNKQEILKQVISKKQTIEIHYINNEKIVSIRKLSDVKYSQEYGLDYIKAYCHTRKEYRTFKISRIKQIRIIQDEFLSISQESKGLLKQVYNKNTVDQNQSMKDVLRYIVTCYGAEIYQDKQRLSNLIADLYTGEERLKRVYRRSISEDLLSIKVYKLSLKPLSQRKGHYEQLIKLYCEENFYSQDLGKQIIDSFVWGLDLPLFISQECEELFVKARQGDAVAQNRLGICYYAGEGIEQDYVEAVKWFQKSAEQGDKWGQYHLAIHYANGNGIEQNYEEAVKWYQKAAEQGYCNAQNRLGVCYYNGDGIEQNYEEAVKWFQKSAEQGYSWGQYNLGNCCYSGKGIQQNYEEAVKWFRKAAEQGNCNAQYNLGICYYNGTSVEQNYKEAVKWYWKAAEQRNCNAQNRLGVCYYNGNGIEQNYEEAVKWFQKSAEQGNCNAQYNLGNCYYNGQGVEQNYEEAVKWLRKSANQGNKDALAFLKEHGITIN